MALAASYRPYRGEDAAAYHPLHPGADLARAGVLADAFDLSNCSPVPIAREEFQASEPAFTDDLSARSEVVPLFLSPSTLASDSAIASCTLLRSTRSS